MHSYLSDTRLLGAAEVLYLGHMVVLSSFFSETGGGREGIKTLKKLLVTSILK